MPATRIGIGILFMLTAVTMFPVMNGLVKLLSGGYDAVQIVWARTVAHLVFVLILFMPRHSIGILRTRQPGTQIKRSVLLLLSTTCFFAGIKYVPLAEAASISLVAPLLVTLLAVPMLGERITVISMLAVVCGFSGVLIVMRPGSDAFQWASLLIAVNALFYGLYQVYTRMAASTDSPETSVVYSALVGSVLTSIAVPFFWTTPTHAFDIAILTSLGVLGGLGHYCVARAMSNGPANIISPFHYFQLIGSVIVGFLLFGDLPTVYTWLGAAIIIGSGLYLGWSESRRNSRGRPVQIADGRR